MPGFFEQMNVVESEGHWTAGSYPVDYFDRGFDTVIADICGAPIPTRTPKTVALGDSTWPLAIIGFMKVPTLCTPEDIQEVAVRTMAASTEYQLSKFIWSGSANTPNFTKNLSALSGGQVVTRGADLPATVGAVVKAAYDRTPYLRPLLHLGFQSAMVLQFGLQNLGIPFIVPPGYPPDAVAVTDRDITVRLSPIVYSQAVITEVNRVTVELTRFAAVEFDVTKAVRAA